MSYAEEMGYDAYDGQFTNYDDSSWLTAEGNWVLIRDMSDKHLFYAYRKSADERLLKEMMLRLFKERAFK